jgi:hypothetical protein
LFIFLQLLRSSAGFRTGHPGVASQFPLLSNRGAALPDFLSARQAVRKTLHFLGEKFFRERLIQRGKK